MLEPEKKKHQKNIINITLAILAGQVGCLTLVIVLGAVLLGLWLDNRMDTRPLYTLILVFASIPVSLIVMFYVARGAVSRIDSRSVQQKSSDTEEA